jgi:ribonuclease R
LGADGLQDSEEPRLPDIAKAISDAERRAMAAERETVDRLIATHLADRVGATFTGRIAGVARSGLFVRLADTGADGFVPVSSLQGDFYTHVEALHALTGKRTGETFSLGDPVEVRLVEAIPSAGALRFEMLSEGKRKRVATMRGAPHRAPKRWKRR